MTTRQAAVLVLLATALLTTGCSIAGGYHVPDGSTRVRSYTSLAGNIEVGREAAIHNAKTVAGDIEIREGSRVGSLTTVAGEIRLAAGVKVEGSIKTVAGGVEIARGCTIAGDVSTVAGDIAITESAVEGNVTFSHGDLELTRTRIGGTVRVRYHKDADTASVTVGQDSEIAALVVDEMASVRLRIHRTAKVGSVKGAVAEYFE